MIFKNLLRRKGRTLLTALGIAIGVAAMIVLGAFAEAFASGYGSMFSGSKADLIVSQPDAFDPAYSAVPESLAPEIAAMPEVQAISGMIQGIVQNEALPYFFVFGYPEDSFILARFQIIEGVSIAERTATRARGKPVMIGSSTAETLKRGIGDTIRIGDGTFRIVGIYQTGDGFEDSGAVLRLEDAQDLLDKARQVSLFYIQVKPDADQTRLMERIQRRWKDYEVSTSETFGNKQLMAEYMTIFVWIVAGLAILIGGVGMMNAQLMAVIERTREIGVLRAVGWSGGRVLRLILSEALIVSALGGWVGLGLGWGVVYLLAETTAFVGVSTQNITPLLLLQSGSVVLVMGVLAGLYPAWRAAQMQPIEALRYESGTSGGKVQRLPFGGMPMQSLAQRSARTLLTLSVISLTVGSILSLDAVIAGTGQLLTNLLSTGDGEIAVRQADIADTSLSAIDARTGEKIAALPQVEHVSGMVLSAVVLPQGQGFFILFGYAPNEYAIRGVNVVEGQPLTTNRQILLGRSIAETLKKSVGDSLVLGGMRFRVTGIYESTIGWEELGGIVTLHDAQSFVGRPNKVTLYMVKLRDPLQAPATVAQINQLDPNVHAALSGEFAEQMPDMQAGTAMLDGMGLLAVLVGGVGVMNTMLMSVLERTREIGVLRALGWRRRAILSLILREALLLGALGGVLGILVGLGLFALMKLEPTTSQMISAAWTLPMFARTLGIALALGAVGGLYPAWRATRLPPVEALRYE